MKEGDLVRFKAGLHGIPEGQNLGIWLGREKRKKAHFTTVWTVKGRKDVRTEHVGERLLAAQVTDLSDEAELAARLGEYLVEFGKKGKAAAPKEPGTTQRGTLDERESWLRLKEPGAFAPERAAEVLFGRVPPLPADVAKVREMLDRAREPGVGYFEKQAGGDEWRPLTPEEYGLVKRDVEGLHRLKRRLVAYGEEVVDGEARTVTRGLALEEAELDEEDQRVLRILQAVMEDFLLHDAWRGTVGLGGTAVHTIDGFQLFPFTKWLAADWLSGGTGTTISSHFAQFLVESGLLTVEEGIRLLARRLVRRCPGFDWETQKAVVEEAERVASRVDAMEAANRRDLRGLDSFTIDPATAKDYDDALTWLPDGSGGGTLWVHIADVSHYVRKDSALDRHARTRGTSVYLPTGVLPMLPPRLSDDLCSLRGGTDRPALSVRLVYGSDGRLRGEAFCESLIRLSRNWHYGQVDAAIAAGSEPFAGLDRLAGAVRRHRNGLDLDTGEREVRVDTHEITHGVKRASPATRLIEVFMVAANEAVARLLARHDVPNPYRCHPLPDREPVARFNGQMKVMGLAASIALPQTRPGAEAPAEGATPEGGVSLLEQLKGGKFTLVGGTFVSSEKAAEPAERTPEAEERAARRVVSAGLAQVPDTERDAWLSPFRRALASIAAVPEAGRRDLATLLLLRTLGRALYTPANYGHFGLGSTCYCHFTSPIRRYPDLLVHRQLRWLLRRLSGAAEDPAPRDLPRLAPAPPEDAEPPHAARHLAPFCATSTDQSVAAERLEWGVKDIALTFASRGAEWQGEQKGVVSGVVAGGLFLTLPGGLEAFLPAREIPGGPFSVDDHESMLYVGSKERPDVQKEVQAGNWRELVDEPSGEVRFVRYTIGDAVRVRIAGRDYAEGRVSVVLARGG